MIIQGDCLEKMKEMADNSIDFIVTDPPYGLQFHNQKWDYQIPGIEIWKEALRIVKPGSMMACFGGSRTHHRLMVAIEDAGWEIRDVIMWIYGSGFPKGSNHFGFKGYSTVLKPAYEPIILAMRPCDGTFKNNADKWKVGGFNIDDSRIETKRDLGRDNPNVGTWNFGKGKSSQFGKPMEKQGRWPANIILDEEAGELLDEQSGFPKYDSGGASRFFYCSKPSSSERNKGCEELNRHPCVKPLSLMKYILKLLAPPNDPVVLDPFAGSGSTLVAARELGIRAMGIELEADYCEIAKKRIEAVA